MIKNREPISMAEAIEYVKDSESGEKDIKKFIKKFIKLTPKKAKELKGKLKDLDLMKIRIEHIIKIIDLMPENAEDLNKIVTEVGLNEDETKKILDTVKEFE